MTIYILDTDHFSLYGRNHPVVIARLLASQVQLLTEILDFVRFLKVKQIQEAVENQQDLDDSHEALIEAREKGTLSLEAFKQELGL